MRYGSHERAVTFKSLDALLDGVREAIREDRDEAVTAVKRFINVAHDLLIDADDLTALDIEELITEVLQLLASHERDEIVESNSKIVDHRFTPVD